MKTPQIRVLGKAAHLSETGLLIVKGVEFIPPYGAKVVNETIEDLGVVHRILGPVKQPIVAIKVICDNPHELVGKKLYVYCSDGKNLRMRKAYKIRRTRKQ